MNLRPLYQTTLAALLATAFYSSQAFSIEGLIATSPTARAAVSTDVTRLLETAFPAYDQATVEKRLADAAKGLQARPDNVTVRTMGGIEKLMGFPASTSRTGEVDTANAYYRLDATKGTAFATHKDFAFTTTPRAQFDSMQRMIEGQHRTLFGSLGLPTDELQKIVFKKTLVQGMEATSPMPTDGSAAEVRRGLTLGYRAFQGFPIEGSFVRAESNTSKRVESFGLAWPKFVVHPQITSFAMQSKEEIKRGILEGLKAHVRTGQQVSLNMGIVFQPVFSTDGRLVHVPAMKVVLTPIAQKTEDGMMTEGGYEFFTNILKVVPAIRNDDGADRNTTSG